jgi:hypothetical protein
MRLGTGLAVSTVFLLSELLHMFHLKSTTPFMADAKAMVIILTTRQRRAMSCLMVTLVNATTTETLARVHQERIQWITTWATRRSKLLSDLLRK